MFHTMMLPAQVPPDAGGATGTTPAADGTAPASSGTPAPAATPTTPAAPPADKGTVIADAGKAPAPAGDGKGTPAPPGEPQAPKAPDKYTLTVPEGGYVLPRNVTQLEAIARKNGWSNEDAQAAIVEFDSMMKSASEAAYNEMNADPEYGGAKLNESKSAIARVLAKYRPQGHPRLESLMRKVNQGIGNDIDFVSLLTDIGRDMAEDRPVSGTASGSAAKGPEDVLYNKPASSP